MLGVSGGWKTLWPLFASSNQMIAALALFVATAWLVGRGRPSAYTLGPALFMLAMSGVPLTAGFVGKFGVFAAAWRANFEWLVIVALVASVAAFFFYLRVIVLMYMHEPAVAEKALI